MTLPSYDGGTGANVDGHDVGRGAWIEGSDIGGQLEVGNGAGGSGGDQTPWGKVGVVS